MAVLTVVLGISLLLLLILVFRLNAFLAFVIVSLSVGLAVGMNLEQAVLSIEKGIGNTLGFLVIILGFGAMLGKLVAESGAAQRITSRLIRAFGLKNIQWALMLTGFIVGVPLFYDVGFVILVPLVFTVAASTGLPLLYVGLPMLASLSVTHGYLPPHPAPTAIATTFGADIGLTLVYGTLVAIPAIIISGPLFGRLVKKVNASPMSGFVSEKPLPEDQLPGLWTSIFSALLPVILIGGSTILGRFVQEGPVYDVIKAFGNPVVAILISLLVAIYSLGIARGRKMKEMMASMTRSVESLTMVMLIIAGAGALKQVLVDGGVSETIGHLLAGSGISPLILGWLIATILRVCLGSATVAGITTAGIVFPLVAGTGVSPELMVLAIGSGSLMLAHVNDGGFWLFKEYFNLSIKDTWRTWTVMETSIGLCGLAGVLVLDMVV
ncbi:MAG: gluconate:H+ symporter [Bacteroidales bacterium]